LEITGIRETIGADRAELWEGEVALVEFEDVAADRVVIGEGDVIADAAGDDAYLVRRTRILPNSVRMSRVPCWGTMRKSPSAL